MTGTNSENTVFNDNGVLVTDTEVRSGKKVYPLTRSSLSKTRSTDHFEIHREETSRRRRRVLLWGTLAGLAVSLWAGWNYAQAVREYSYVTGEQMMSEVASQGIAFAIAAGLSGIALLGLVLCVQVSQPYRMHHVYLESEKGRQRIASSRNEAWIADLSAVLNQAIARLSAASTGHPANSRSRTKGALA